MPDWFGADKFERAFKSALKHCDISVTERKSDNLYVLSMGQLEIEADTTAVRQRFMKTRSQNTLDNFADELSYRFSLEGRLNSFTNAQSCLRLIVLREDEPRDGMIYSDFAGTLKKAVCYVGERNDIHMLDEKYLRRWSVPKEVLFSVADRNMGRFLAKTDFNFTEITQGVNVVEFEAKGDALVVSAMLCTDFRDFITEKLGYPFFVAAPSRETLLAVHDIPDSIFCSLGEAVARDNKWADSPLTTEIFCFTPDGVSVAAKF